MQECKTAFQERKNAFFEALHQALTDGTNGALYLYPHVRADGDALSSSIGLAKIAKKLGKEAMVWLDEAPSEKLLAQIPQAGDFVQVYRPERLEEAEQKQDIGLLIDCHEAKRIEERAKLYESAKRFFTIDHHLTCLSPAPDRWIDASYAAAAEMVGDFLCYLEQQGLDLLDADLAQTLMLGLLTDTGRFCFSNTTAKTFEMASYLMRYPVDVRQMTRALFDELSSAKVQLISIVYDRVQYEKEGRIALSTLPMSLFQKTGAVDSDLEGLAGSLRDITGVELAIFLRETQTGLWRGNLRAGEAYNAERLARALGGGGHLRAAGFSIQADTAETAVQHLLETIERLGEELVCPS